MKSHDDRVFRGRVLAALLAASSLVAAISHACAQTAPDNINVNLYGTPGLVDMPGAHMAPDGTFRLVYVYRNFTNRYGFAFQALPWLEGSFMYTGTPNLTQSGAYYDRSFGLKVRLSKEDNTWPDISVGATDIVGTSLESGEYLVASKNIGPIDATLGMGWGRLAGTADFRNPFTLIFPSFATRKQVSTGLENTGQVQFGQFFHGPKASLFGGLLWHTPLTGLDLVAEYSSDIYQRETTAHVFTPRNQFNFEASYQVFDELQLGVGWMYGNTFMARVSFSIDPTKEQFSQRIGTAAPEPAIRPDIVRYQLARGPSELPVPQPDSIETFGNDMMVSVPGAFASKVSCSDYENLVATAHSAGLTDVVISDGRDRSGRVMICSGDDGKKMNGAEVRFASYEPDTAQFAVARAKIVQMAAQQNLTIEAVRFEGNRGNVAFTNQHYRTEDEAYGRLARVMMAASPTETEVFHFISLANGAPAGEITIGRSTLERAAVSGSSGAEILPSVAFGDDGHGGESAQILDADSVRDYPLFDWSIVPEYNQSLFDPNQPYRFQILAGIEGGFEPMRELRFDAELQTNIYDTFSDLRPSNSALPHVRSDFKEYFDQGKNGIALLRGTYVTTVEPDVFVLARAGLLESMFAGAGGEILWRPEGERFAIGADLYHVWQRGFDRLFDMRDYHVWTGHVSFYWQTPYHGLNLNIHVGQYLAGDRGVTVEVTRRFDTGIEIGAFATFTNVPFSEFGEGSFDKGFIIKIPLDWFAPIDSQSEVNLNLRPLTRDGGQMLAGEQSLYGMTDRMSYGPVLRNADSIVAP